MRKLLTCLCIFTICLGVFTGCADNRVPQPDEGTEGFEQIPESTANELDISYEDVKGVVESALRAANINVSKFKLVSIDSFLSDPDRCSLYGTIDEKPLNISLVKNENGPWTVDVLTSLSIPRYYWLNKEAIVSEQLYEQYSRNMYDFYTGKKLSSVNSSQG